MKLYIMFKQSFKAIFANKGRSILTVLGIVIGIASVISLVSLGTGVKVGITDQISTLGTTNITVLPGGGFGSMKSHGGGAGFALGGGSSLTEKDLEAITNQKKHPLVKCAAGQVSGSVLLKTSKGEQRYTVLGTSRDFVKVEKLTVDRGRTFGEKDITESTKVVVLGSQLAADLYGKKDPVGRTMEIQGTPFEVIGVLDPAEENGLNDPNNEAIIPYTSSWETFHTQGFNMITAQAKSEDVVRPAKWDIKKALLVEHDIKESRLADFTVTSAADLLSVVDTITSMLTSLLAGIAAISLVVGGIGIMNIMLVSVTERTREIGLRKAVGAKTFDILGQFVVEAILLTLCGGVLGIGGGILVARVLGPVVGFTPVVTANSILLAVGVASTVGLLFGVYPAAKAAALDPIDALRYE